MDDIWFEEELFVPSYEIDDETKSLLQFESRGRIGYLSECLGVVRVSKPRWEYFGNYLINNRESRFFKVRLRYQFDPIYDHLHFKDAKCEAFIQPENKLQELPRVFDIFPRTIEIDNPMNFNLNFQPKISFASLEVSLGEIGATIDTCTITPIVIGYPGTDDRNPYWILRPSKNIPIKGMRDFWLVIEQPLSCDATLLKVRTEASVQAHFGPVPLAPKHRVWDSRPAIIIS